MVHVDFAQAPASCRNDQEPALVGEGLLVGSMYHAGNVDLLARLGVTAVLNCARSGLRTVPRDVYREKGIHYASTRVKRDDHTYPILHEADGARSGHLTTALELYTRTRSEGGKVLFFCAAGQNRSATLAAAVLLLSGEALAQVMARFAQLRPCALENAGFQQQLVELESFLGRTPDMPIATVAGELGEGPGADAVAFKLATALGAEHRWKCGDSVDDTGCCVDRFLGA